MDYQIDGIDGLGVKGELWGIIVSGKFKEHDLLVYNAYEAELGPETDYYEMGKYVKSYTEITGASNPNRFIPRLDNVHIISWPYHWLNDTICRYGSKGDQIDLNYFKEINAYPPPKHLFTSMIRQPKPHREMLWDLLKSRDMVNEFCSYAPEGVHIDLKEQKSEGQIFFHNDDEDIQARTHMPPTWYKDVLFDVICETHHEDNMMFFTEKTWKAFLGMKYPLILGAKGIHAHLEKLGFRFPWNLPYRFDGEPHIYNRAKQLVLTLEYVQEATVKRVSQFGKEATVGDLYKEWYNDLLWNQRLALNLCAENPPDCFGSVPCPPEWYRHWLFSSSIATNTTANL